MSAVVLNKRAGLALLCGLAGGWPVRADDATVKSATQAIAQDLPAGDAIKSALRAKLQDPDLLNGLLDTLRQPAAGAANNVVAGVLSNLNIRFKAFETKGTTGTALGLQYDYERPLVTHEFDPSVGFPLSLTFSLHAKGDVAFDQTKNPNDFLDTGGSFNFFGSKGGFEPVVDKATWRKAMDDLSDRAAAFRGTPAELDRDPAWLAVTGKLDQQLSTQYFWRAVGNFSLESNQSFTSRQTTYGLHASGVIRAWNDQSAWAQFNVFDWPFACLRYLTGADPALRPSGRAIPLVLVGIDQVDPTKDTARLAADPDKSSFGRWRGEAAMKTKVAKIADQDLWFVADYRIYDEMSPSAKIRTAQLDRFEYFAMGFELKSGASFTYSTGKLPLDRKSDQVYDLGYKVKF